ncbi:hypothetical protein [Mammaliicoccus sciuri]|uniref:hypothetical protein n=1 Tax=Mammaliicoccus sciuri TaxID=1296 RepID=UPI001F16DF10|nr:hypothetical protein [Mammaliicoccus sciuri]MCE5086084.1 hypothetical protein [Mammaliicoccus sciuri]
MDIRNVDSMYFRDILNDQVVLIQCKTTKEVHCWKAGLYIGMIKKAYISKYKKPLEDLKNRILTDHVFLDKAIEV